MWNDWQKTLNDKERLEEIQDLLKRCAIELKQELGYSKFNVYKRTVEDIKDFVEAPYEED
tara:strand:+ start:156 stop:335 length:180 start_codon:yes stop_codon:yes gene_type:complete